MHGCLMSAFYKTTFILKRITLILLLAIAFGAVDGFAQKTAVLWYNKVGLEEGLSSPDYNFYVYVDTEGFCWISSMTGLNRYDGHSVKQYHSDFRDSTALFGENIQSRFFEDRRHNLWFCTYEAVHCYDRRHDTFRHYFVRNENGGWQQEDYQVFALEQDSLLWFRAGQQVYRVNVDNPGQTAALFPAAKPIYSTTYYHFFTGTAPDGALRYIFSSTNEKLAGLECVEIQRGAMRRRRTYFDKQGPNPSPLNVFQVYFENPENIWLTTQKGLVKWNLDRPDSIRLYDFQFTGYSYLAPSDPNHFFVSFSNKGLYLFDKSNGHWMPYPLKPVRYEQHAATLNPRNLFLDRNNVLWVTTPLEGVVYAHPGKRKFGSFPNPEFFRGKEFLFRNLLYDPAGQVWCCYNGGFFLLDRAGALLDHIPINAGRDQTVVLNFARGDSVNGIWAATSRGLRLYHPDRRNFERIPGLEGVDVLYLYRLRDGPLLATTLFGNIYAIEKKDGAWHTRTVLAAGGIAYTSIFEDRRGRIYICRNEAGIEVFEYRGDTLRQTTTLPVRGAINSFCEAPPNGQTLWIGSSFGLVKINTEHLDKAPEVFTEKQGLPNNNVLGIVPGMEDTLWLSTMAGLAVFEEQNKTFHGYSPADGTMSKRFDKFACLPLPGGEIWFGGSEGITVVPAVTAPAIETPPAVLLTGLKINDELPSRVICAATGATNLNQLQRLELPFAQNTLSFSFAAVDFAYPPGTRVAYKLEGMDKDWVELNRGEAGFARYPNLSPGDYVFQVRGANSDGRWNDAPRRLLVRILAPYWKTWWFQGGLLLAGLLVAAVLVLYRINQVRKTEQLKRRIAENKMAALIAQMNPHFIFNSLQSINSYILRNNRKKASEYLGRFSRLMRMILEGSRNALHSIEKERELLELYLKVETQRFKEPFQYDIVLDESLDTYGTQIPSMMLQPFVENAIWHGLAQKEGAGFIQISIENAGSILRCTVSDNGVGRKKSAELSLQKGKAHESRALQILSERLELLFPGQQNLCAVRYTDLMDDEGRPAGTKVEISLPLVG